MGWKEYYKYMAGTGPGSTTDSIQDWLDSLTTFDHGDEHEQSTWTSIETVKTKPTYHPARNGKRWK